MPDTYQQAGYQSEQIGFGESPAILVVDFQLAFTDPSYPLGGFPMIQEAVEHTARLLAIARERGILIACCYTAYSSQREIPYWKVDALHKDFFRDHPCTALDPRTHDPRTDLVFSKGAASIFFQTPLLAALTKRRVDTTIITGCTTSGCVRASVVDSFSYGYRTIVPAQCCGDAERGPHEANLDDIRRRYADVLDLEEVIDQLRRY